MARFYGKIGYAMVEETAPGIWMDTIVEKAYYGTSNRIIARADSAEKVNDDLSLNNEISIIADPFAYEHYSHIRYVEFMGVKWKVTAVQVQRPRLILNIGKVYSDDEITVT
jgi:hypothetical protein